MEKPYDIKELFPKLKEAGLEGTEEAVKLAVPVFFDWLIASAAKSENKYDDLLSPLIPIVKKYVMDLAEDINGQDNPG